VIQSRPENIMEQKLVAGRETFTRWHSLSLGFMLSRQWDLWTFPSSGSVAGVGEAAFQP
jgi:hypothetical protein